MRRTESFQRWPAMYLLLASILARASRSTVARTHLAQRPQREDAAAGVVVGRKNGVSVTTQPDLFASFSPHQERALLLCLARYPTCPFGCAKDGAANCDAHVRGRHAEQCEPGRKTYEAT